MFKYLLLLIPVLVLSQKKYIDEISYQQANDITFFKSIKNGTTTNSYVFEDGNKISVGDTLTLGSPTSGSSYSNAYGGASNVNGTNAAIANIRTKNKKEYEFIKNRLHESTKCDIIIYFFACSISPTANTKLYGIFFNRRTY